MTSGATVVQSIQSRCAACSIRPYSVCGALSAEDINALSSIARKRVVPAGDAIVEANVPLPFFANIVSGVVKLSKLMADGRLQIVGLQFQTDFLGRPYRDSSPFWADAVTDVELCVFPKDRFEALLKSNPEVETRLFKFTLDELDAARDWMLLLGRKTASERVATFLSLLARRKAPASCDLAAPDTKIELVLPLTRAEMADYLGLTIETVSRQVSALKTKKILEVGENRSVKILDYNGLVEISQV